VPMGQVRSRLDELPRDRPVAVVCHLGGRSAQVTAFLVASGFDARNVEGGMRAWAAAGLPLEAEPGVEPVVD
jgi:rhodanese-related sulfurtransferase